MPRGATWLGLIGGPLIIASGTALLFTGNDSDTLRTLQGIATIPEFAWELFLGVYCTIRGFRRESTILEPDTREEHAAPALPAVATG